MSWLLAQVVLAFVGTAEPARFGVAVPARVLDVGLSLRPAAPMQWRPLPLPPRAGRCWIELACLPGRGRCEIVLGGAPPDPSLSGTGAGAALALTATIAPTIAPTIAATIAPTMATAVGSVAEWRWCDGSSDRRERTAIGVATEYDGELFTAGETLTCESAALAERALPALSLPRRYWEQVGLLPPGGTLAAPLRAHLQQVGHALKELPGRRGAGDHARSGGVVTNLEFDTGLALLRLAVALGDAELWRRARRAAWHLVDRDLDARSGLPFAHGPDHRQNPPEPGHAWLQGLLWCGLVAGDEELVARSHGLASALASSPPAGEGVRERARDYAWPLAELEAWLQFADDPVVALAADRLAQSIALRFCAAEGTFCFGEGEANGPGYFERGWITGGIVLPALQAHLRRRPDPELEHIVQRAVAVLLDRIGQGRGGLPTHWRTSNGVAFAEHRAEHDPKAFLLLEALPPRDLQRLLRKSHVLRGLLATPALDDPDLPTDFAIAARCSWVYR